VQRGGRQDDLPPGEAAGKALQAVRVVDAAADARAGRGHEHDGHVVPAAGGPPLVAGELEQVHDVEGVVAELDLADGPAAGVGDAQGGAEDAALVEWGVPGGAEALRGGEHAAERRPDVLAQHVGDAEVLLAVVQRHAASLNERGHGRVWRRGYGDGRNCPRWWNFQPRAVRNVSVNRVG